MPAGTTALVSYVVPTPGATVDPSAIREHVARSLPSHMVPSLVIALDEIPLTRTGKLDRAALPTPDPGQLAGTGEVVAPRTPVEAQLAEIVADVLGHKDVNTTRKHYAAIEEDRRKSARNIVRLREPQNSGVTDKADTDSTDQADITDTGSTD